MIFDSKGKDISPQILVRNMYMISEFTPNATGLKITQKELKKFLKPEYLMNMLHEIMLSGSSTIPFSFEQIINARKSQNLSHEHLHKETGVSFDNIQKIETKRRVDIHEAKKICDALGLDMKKVGFPKNAIK